MASNEHCLCHLAFEPMRFMSDAFKGSKVGWVVVICNMLCNGRCGVQLLYSLFMFPQSGAGVMASLTNIGAGTGGTFLGIYHTIVV